MTDIELLSQMIGYQGDLGYQDAVDSADAVAKVGTCPLGACMVSFSGSLHRI